MIKKILKLFRKETSANGRVRIYFCGIKIASYDSYYNKTVKKFRKTHKINFDDKNIVSLGFNCFPRTILTNWGLKRTKSMGELSYPFDLAIHYTEDLTKLLNNNFRVFFNNLSFYHTHESWMKPESTGFWKNKKYIFRYVHDEDCGETEKDKLITRLENRVKNWNAMIKSKKTSYFVLYIDANEMKLTKKTATNIAKNLIKTIFNLRKELPTKIIIISTIKIDINIDKVFVLYSPLPWKGYIWAKDKITYKGTIFEQKIANFCYNILGNKD